VEARTAYAYIASIGTARQAAAPTRSIKETIMNINLRALVFGVAVAAAMTVTIDSVVAAESPRVVRLDTIEVTSHRSVDDVAEVDVVHLDPIVVTAHKTN
jgi:hypothetical protein